MNTKAVLGLDAVLEDVLVVVEAMMGLHSSRLSFGGGGDFRISMGGLAGAASFGGEPERVPVDGGGSDIDDGCKSRWRRRSTFLGGHGCEKERGERPFVGILLCNFE